MRFTLFLLRTRYDFHSTLLLIPLRYLFDLVHRCIYDLPDLVDFVGLLYTFALRYRCSDHSGTRTWNLTLYFTG